MFAFSFFFELIQEDASFRIICILLIDSMIESDVGKRFQRLLNNHFLAHYYVETVGNVY